MVNPKKTHRRKQKGGLFGGLMKRIINATGGVKMKDGSKRKFNLKHSPYRRNEPFFLPKQKGGFRYSQKGGTAVPIDYNYTNRYGWRGWGNHWWPGHMGKGRQKGGSWWHDYPGRKQKGGWWDDYARQRWG